ncbi:MAG: DUF5667 domain-containing protein [Chloroflexota bacterium]
MKAQDQIEQAERALEKLTGGVEPNPLRQASARGGFLEQAARLRAGPGPVRANPRQRIGWVRVVVASAVVVFLALGALTGAAAAADAAVPGDALYPLDRYLEDLRLSSVQDPADAAALLLEFADERLQEAEDLAAEGAQEQLAVALEAYDQTVADLAKAVGSTGGADQQALGKLLDQALSTHEERLLEIRAQAPEQALPGLDRAIEASQNARGDGPPEDRGNGRPEDRGNGRPEDRGNGPPEDRGDGPPEDRGDGRPEEKPGNRRGRPDKTPRPP